MSRAISRVLETVTVAVMTVWRFYRQPKRLFCQRGVWELVGNAVKVGMLQHRWTGWLRGGDATPRAVITPTLIRNRPLPLLSLQRGFEN